MIDDALMDATDRMEKALEALRRDLATVRTGRASPGLVEHLKVDYYGAPTPLNQLATISTPDARLLTIQPWDRGSIGAIEKAILKSDLGLNPSNDGTLIRLAIPQLTEERRRELAKQVRKQVEEGRVAVRNIRRDAHENSAVWSTSTRSPRTTFTAPETAPEAHGRPHQGDRQGGPGEGGGGARRLALPASNRCRGRSVLYC